MSKIWVLYHYNSADNTAEVISVFLHKPDFDQLWEALRLPCKDVDQLYRTCTVTVGKHHEYRLETVPVAFFGEIL